MRCSIYGLGGDDIIEIYRTLPAFKSGELRIIKKAGDLDSAGLLLDVPGGDVSVWVIKGADIGLYGDFGKACVVTCGLSQRDSISVSSISDKALTLSVQRELPTVDNGTVCQQEFRIRCDKLTDAETAAVAAGGILCMGVNPAELDKIVF